MRRSSLGEAAARFAPHALGLCVVAAAVAGLPYFLAPVGLLFLAAPLIEIALGEGDRTAPRGNRVACVASCLAPWAWLPAQAGVLTVAIFHLRQAPDLAAAAWLAVPAGMLSGMFGMAAAHELMHRAGRAARCAAALLLASCGYGHFLIEHLAGHHRRAGMPEDPATARLGESVFAFLPRAIGGGFASAWSYEAGRLRSRGLVPFGMRNTIVALGAVSIAMCAAAVLVAGIGGVVFFAVHALVSVSILEIVNYIQHYGLVRSVRASDEPRSVAVSPAWDCAFRMTNLLLLDLGFHAEHHLRPARPSSELAGRPDAPRLPAGYFTLFVLALLPPLWAQIMDPRARLARASIMGT